MHLWWKFSRDSVVQEREYVPGGGERALLFAISILIDASDLQAGNHLRVDADESDDDISVWALVAGFSFGGLCSLFIVREGAS